MNKSLIALCGICVVLVGCQTSDRKASTKTDTDRGGMSTEQTSPDQTEQTPQE